MKATKFSQFLQDREELKFVDRPHWIYVAEALILSVIIIIAGIYAHNFIANDFIYPELRVNNSADGLIINIMAVIARITLWGSIIGASIYFLNRLIFWASTYIFASDRRLYQKTGIVRVVVNEVSFEEIRKTDVNYGLLGRFLGYGKLMMDARFVQDSEIPYIYNPETFSKIIHKSNDLASDIDLSYVTNNMPDKVDKIVPKKDDVKDQIDPLEKHEKKFEDFAFSKEEKEKIKSNDEENIISDFEETVDIPNNDIEKPASHDAPKAISN